MTNPDPDLDPQHYKESMARKVGYGIDEDCYVPLSSIVSINL